MAISDALAEAARWRLASLLLERPRRGWLAEVRTLAREVDDRDLRKAAGLASEASEGDYLALLGPGGAVAAREVEYRRGRDPGWILSDLARFYEAFAFRPRAEDPVDHFAVEVGFVGYLWLKETMARSADDDERAEVTARARQTFVADHLAGVVQEFARRTRAAGDASHILTAASRIADAVPDAPLPVGTLGVPVLDDDACAAAGCGGPREDEFSRRAAGAS